MNDPQERVSASNEDRKDEVPTTLPFPDADRAALNMAANAIVQPALTNDQLKLIRLRETGAIDGCDYDLGWVYGINQEEGRALTRKDIELQAIVIEREDFKWLGHIRYIDPTGDEQIIDADNFHEEVFILFPDDLGN